MIKAKRNIRTAAIIIVIVAASYIISNNYYQLILIHGNSMYPAYHSWQPAVINRRNRAFASGDVVALRCAGLHAVLVKRIAGCPGDVVEVRDGHLLVNGAENGFYANQEIAYAGLLAEPIALEADEYIVLGDNLSESRDSRYEEVGIVHGDEIIGKL